MTGDKALIHLGATGVARNVREAMQLYNAPVLSRPLPSRPFIKADTGPCGCTLRDNDATCADCRCTRLGLICTSECRCGGKCKRPSILQLDTGLNYCNCGPRSKNICALSCACKKAGRPCTGKCGCGPRCPHRSPDDNRARDKIFCACAIKDGSRACVNCVCVRYNKPCSAKCSCRQKGCGNQDGIKQAMRHGRDVPDGPCNCFGDHGGVCSKCRCVLRGQPCTPECGCNGSCNHTEAFPPIEGPVLPMETEGPLLPMDVVQESPPEPKSPPPDEVKGPRVAESPSPLEPDAVPSLFTYQPCECKGKCDPATCRCKIDKLLCTSACDCKSECEKQGCKCVPSTRDGVANCHKCYCTRRSQGCDESCTCKGECRYKGKPSDNYIWGSYCRCTPDGAQCLSCQCSRKKRPCSDACGCKGKCPTSNIVIDVKKRKAEKPLKSILKKKVRFTLDLTDQKEEPQNGLDVLVAASSAASTSSTSAPIQQPVPMDTAPQPVPRQPGAGSYTIPPIGWRLPLQRPAAPASEFAASFAAGAAAAIQQPAVPMDQKSDRLTRVATQLRIAQAAQDRLKSMKTPSPSAIAACDKIQEACLMRMAAEMDTQ